jgi:hypothetical protein
MGKLLFGFGNLWGYLWYCQSMLIWYVNSPEEAVWYTRRLEGGWAALFHLNVLLNWVVPLVVLLPRAARGRVGVLAAVSLVLLTGRWLDLYLEVVPCAGGAPLTGAAWEVGIAVGTAGLFGLVFFAALGRAAVVPVGDPFLAENLQEPALVSSDPRDHAAIRVAAKQGDEEHGW